MCDHRGQIGTNECEIGFLRLGFRLEGNEAGRPASCNHQATPITQLNDDTRFFKLIIFFRNWPPESHCRNSYANPFLFYAVFDGNFHGLRNVCVRFRLNLYGTH